MQSDDNLDRSFLQSECWEQEPITGLEADQIERMRLPSLERGKLSFSGNERNRLFRNESGRSFVDISGVSGMDSPKDGRGFAIWDFDRDGFQDIALVSINTPVLQLFRNQAGATNVEANRPGNMIAFQLVGGNRTATASPNFSNRDGIGATVKVQLSDRNLVQHRQCGEGLGAQNSSLLLLGTGEHDVVEKIEVQWPSGIKQTIHDVAVNQMVTVYENDDEAPDKSGFQLQPYLASSKDPVATAIDSRATFAPPVNDDSVLTLYTAMATWCPNCRQQIPQLELLRGRFDADQLQIVGLPVDETETDEQLQQYLSENHPPYELAGDWSIQERSKFKLLVQSELEFDPLPASVIVDREGNVRFVSPGVPSLSDITRLLTEQ